MIPPRRRVVITGLGVVSPAGHDLPAFWQTLSSGRSCVREIRRFDASGFPTRFAAEIEGFRLTDHADVPSHWEDLGPIAGFAAAAAGRAVEDSGLLKTRPSLDLSRAGVLVAAGMGSYAHEEVFAPCAAARSANNGAIDWRAFAEKLRGSSPPRGFERRTPGSIPAVLAQRFGFRGPVMAVMTACAAGTQALGDAARWVSSGMADVVLAGGADSELYPMGLASFCLLGALSRRNEDPASASRPFDASRDGFVIGEGAGMLIVEERAQALRRGARVYAEIAGFGSASDAWRATDPNPEGRGAVLAMSRALSAGAAVPTDVGYINAHGTSTPANDRAETLAIKKVFGEAANRVAVSSTKSMIGHLTAAAGAVEAIATVLTLLHQTIPPTINYRTPDRDCDLDYVPNRSRQRQVEYALSNSFGFGGQCASLLLRREAS